MKNVTVESLRNKGYKVRVTHLRRYNHYATDQVGLQYVVGYDYLGTHDLADPKFALPTGGITEVEVTTPDNRTFVAKAECSNNDPYNKKIGVKIALGRVMRCLEEDDCSECANDRPSFLKAFFGL